MARPSRFHAPHRDRNLFGLTVYITCLLISAKKRKDDRNKMQIVYDLNPLLDVLRMKINNYAVKEEDNQRATLALEKYKRWVPEGLGDAGLYARLVSNGF